MQRRSQLDRTRSTRGQLEQAARELFAERGFTAVSAEEIVAAAGVTRGALQYHYGDKRGLFVAVLEQLERENSAELAAAMAAVPPSNDPMAGLREGLDTFLRICRRPEMVQIALSDAPAVLGWHAWRDFEVRYGLGLLIEQFEAARSLGLLADAPVRMLAQVVLSAVTEAGMIVAHSEDQATAHGQALDALVLLIGGLLRS
ncbi:TetR/AcrR family transcriptional regulator [Nocardia farcinica]|uniref:TetR/AcrR family transcriptional regulator n=1 Tax=Nocardia farcinica TaxID=37329 RepID=UPI0018954E95|nr:TetR/AcrR family transcriptional regulator [Nocardia farcinica]MBF6068208.1 TetR/AcrR family transcriptional regulator [Nocardia farcinica]MBF6252117.1 TetR/AcrR family transcriptional regulator [Nocardia farcinica]